MVIYFDWWRQAYYFFVEHCKLGIVWRKIGSGKSKKNLNEKLRLVVVIIIFYYFIYYYLLFILNTVDIRSLKK